MYSFGNPTAKLQYMCRESAAAARQLRFAFRHRAVMRWRRDSPALAARSADLVIAAGLRRHFFSARSNIATVRLNAPCSPLAAMTALQPNATNAARTMARM